jgi:ribonuclease HI
VAKKRFYAVKVGKKPGIYKSWPECQKAVDGFSGAVFKGFEFKSDAKAYMAEKKPVKQPKSRQAAKKPESEGRFWLDPAYDKRLKDGRWNPKYS